MAAALFGTDAVLPVQGSEERVEAALTNIVTLLRSNQDGLAAFWDGNKYVQCRRMADSALRCEAAGTLMQPSLARVLTPERVARLAALGWQLDPSFGNYVQTFPAGIGMRQIADRVLNVLREAYDADLTQLEVRTDWIKSEPCPPRNGPTQNLAGMINDGLAMAATAVYGCSYKPAPETGPAPLIRAKAEVLDLYRARVIGEIQRLRVNIDRPDFVFVVVDTGAGYVQCGPERSAQAIYCEAQSVESWPVLARILTPDRVAALHAAGFADPGRSPNYSRNYPAGEFTDGAIAEALLSILCDVYGYNGVPALVFQSEKGRS
jgi:hypothetical protein